MIVLTAVIGSVLLRIQGFGLLTRMRDEVDQGHAFRDATWFTA